MGFEVEVKYRATAGHDDVALRLAEAGARLGEPIAQVDSYLSHPSRDFAMTNEALRIRRVGAENRITYKGPRREGPTKTRKEIEISFTEGEDSFSQLRTLFEHLGFKAFATVRKTRRPFHMTYLGRPLEIVLDDVEGLGAFVEVEAIASEESDLPAAQQAVLALARDLGLSEVETRSYLRMTVDRTAVG